MRPRSRRGFSDVKDVVSSRTARIMTSMLEDVVAARNRHRRGHPETTGCGQDRHHQRFHRCLVRRLFPQLSCGVWIGYDEKKSLGAREKRGPRRPAHVDRFHEVALSGKDPGEFQPPSDIPPNPAAVKVDTPDTALPRMRFTESRRLLRLTGSSPQA